MKTRLRFQVWVTIEGDADDADRAEFRKWIEDAFHGGVDAIDVEYADAETVE